MCMGCDYSHIKRMAPCWKSINIAGLTQRVCLSWIKAFSLPLGNECDKDAHWEQILSDQSHFFFCLPVTFLRLHFSAYGVDDINWWQPYSVQYTKVINQTGRSGADESITIGAEDTANEVFRSRGHLSQVERFQESSQPKPEWSVLTGSQSTRISTWNSIFRLG